jgi:hypothetical protein
MESLDLSAYDLNRLAKVQFSDLVVTLDASINNDKKNRYLTLFSSNHNRIIEKLIEKTTYITYVQFATDLLQNFNSLKTLVKDLDFYVRISGDDTIYISLHWWR